MKKRVSPDDLQVKFDFGVLLRQLVHAEPQPSQDLSRDKEPIRERGSIHTHSRHLEVTRRQVLHTSHQEDLTDLSPCLHGVPQITHHNLGLVLFLVSTGQPGEGLENQTRTRSCYRTQPCRYCFAPSTLI